MTSSVLCSIELLTELLYATTLPTHKEVSVLRRQKLTIYCIHREIMNLPGFVGRFVNLTTQKVTDEFP